MKRWREIYNRDRDAISSLPKNLLATYPEILAAADADLLALHEVLGAAAHEYPDWQVVPPAPIAERRESLPVTTGDPDHDRRALARLYFAILRDSLNDLDALLAGKRRISGDEILTEEEARASLRELKDWFLRDVPARCSLDLVCEALRIDSEKVRQRVRNALKERCRARIGRRRLSPEELAELRQLVLLPIRTPELAERFAVDGSTIRKIRIATRAGRARYGQAA